MTQLQVLNPNTGHSTVVWGEPTVEDKAVPDDAKRVTEEEAQEVFDYLMKQGGAIFDVSGGVDTSTQVRDFEEAKAAKELVYVPAVAGG